MSGTALARILLEVLAGRAAPVPAVEPSVLEERLRALHATARAAWPGVSLEADDFVRCAAERLELRTGLDESLAALCAADLYLARACARGDRAALRGFEERLLSQVPRFLSRLSATPSLCEEVTQELRAELLAPGAGAPPQIAGYSGRGDLAGWVRIVAIRTALRLRREQGRLSGGNEAEAARPLLGADPELDYLKLRYRKDYEQAFESALAKLSKRERLYLRLHYLDGLSIDKLSGLYRVHRSTIARRLAAHREKLYQSTREILRERLQVSDSEFESLLGLVRSQLAVSVRSALAKSQASSSPG